MRKYKLMKKTNYLSTKKAEISGTKNKVSIEENEQNVKIYFVQHLLE